MPRSISPSPGITRFTAMRITMPWMLLQNASNPVFRNWRRREWNNSVLKRWKPTKRALRSMKTACGNLKKASCRRKLSLRMRKISLKMRKSPSGIPSSSCLTAKNRLRKPKRPLQMVKSSWKRAKPHWNRRRLLPMNLWIMLLPHCKQNCLKRKQNWRQQKQWWQI